MLKKLIWWSTVLLAAVGVLVAAPVGLVYNADADIVVARPLPPEQEEFKDALAGLTNKEIYLTTGVILVAVEALFLIGLVITRRKHFNKRLPESDV